MPFERSSKWKLLCLVVGLLAIFTVMGCGGNDDGDASAADTTAVEASDSDASADAGADSGDVVALAQEKVAELTKTTDVEFPVPDESFDPGKKKAAVIMAGQDEGFTAMVESLEEAADTMGWELGPTWDGKFSPATQSSFVQQAVNEGYDAIILLVIEAANIESALHAANAENIPVACLMCENKGAEDKIIDVTTGGQPGGEAVAWYVIAESEGKAKILLVDDQAYGIVDTRVKGFEDAIEANCPDCEIVETMQISPASMAQPGPPEWLGALRRFAPGDFDIAVMPYDYYAVPAGKTALEQAREVGITGYDGLPEMVRLIEEDGPVFKATISAPFEYLPWAALDQVARASAGLDTWDTSSLPLRLVTADNAAEFPHGWYVPSDFDAKAEFGAVWSGQ